MLTIETLCAWADAHHAAVDGAIRSNLVFTTSAFRQSEIMANSASLESHSGISETGEAHPDALVGSVVHFACGSSAE
jgi:hypothetical protein